VATDAAKIQLVVGGSAASHNSMDWCSISVRTDPEPCAVCITARIAEQRAESLRWDTGSLRVRVLKTGSPVPGGEGQDTAAAAAASAGVSGAGAGAGAVTVSPSDAAKTTTTTTTSLRLRRRRAAAQSTTTEFETEVLSSAVVLSTLKACIFMHTDISPDMQQLFCDGREIRGDNLTLVDHGISLTSDIYVRHMNISCGATTSDPCGGGGGGGASSGFGAGAKRHRALETGFVGTALSSRTSTPPKATAAAAASSSSSSSSSGRAIAFHASSMQTEMDSVLAWQCTHCTFENEPAHLACAICTRTRIA